MSESDPELLRDVLARSIGALASEPLTYAALERAFARMKAEVETLDRWYALYPELGLDAVADARERARGRRA